MPRIEFSESFASDLASVESSAIQARVLSNIENIRCFAEFGNPNLPESIKREFGKGVRKVAVNPFDLVYTYYPDLDLVRIEALVHQRTAW